MTAKKFLREKIKVGERELSVEIGRVAKQASGSCVIRYGDTMLLVAAVGAQTPTVSASLDESSHVRSSAATLRRFVTTS